MSQSRKQQFIYQAELEDTSYLFYCYAENFASADAILQNFLILAKSPEGLILLCYGLLDAIQSKKIGDANSQEALGYFQKKISQLIDIQVFFKILPFSSFKPIDPQSPRYQTAFKKRLTTEEVIFAVKSDDTNCQFTQKISVIESKFNQQFSWRYVDDWMGKIATTSDLGIVQNRIKELLQQMDPKLLQNALPSSTAQIRTQLPPVSPLTRSTSPESSSSSNGETSDVTAIIINALQNTKINRDDKKGLANLLHRMAEKLELEHEQELLLKECSTQRVNQASGVTLPYKY